MRTERTQLQHEVDILQQRIGQDSGTLKDELKGMFDDRKMAVRMERRERENRIQELNYKITTSLNSELRSEVEGLRLLLTRRAVFAIVAVAIMALVALRASKAMEAKQAKERKALEAGGGKEGEVVNVTSQEMAKRFESGDNPALVSLG